LLRSTKAVAFRVEKYGEGMPETYAVVPAMRIFSRRLSSAWIIRRRKKLTKAIVVNPKVAV